MAARIDGEDMGRGVIGRILVAALLAAPATAAAQTPEVLARVDSLVAVGHTEEARVALTDWWQRAGAPAAATTKARAPIDRDQMQHAIWLRAILTVDPTQAAVDYQRLAVEFPGGVFTDRALLRLAQAADAHGDAAKARDHLRALLRDYPSSPTRQDATRLLASVEPAAETQAAAVTPPRTAPLPPPSPATASDSIVLSGAMAGSWTVQVGAFASPERARALGAEVAAGGNEVRIVMVPPSRLIRVRTGRFLSQQAAERLRSTLVARGQEATVAGDADREETSK